MSSDLDQEFRSRELADNLRQYLLTVNSGGIAILFSIASTLIENKIKANWLVCPTIAFALGILFCIISNFLAQHRALKRRDAAKDKLPEPEFCYLMRSWTWNTFSAISFLVGVILALYSFQSMKVV